MRSVCRGTETSERLARTGAYVRNSSCVNFAPSESKFLQLLTQAFGVTTRLPRRPHVNVRLYPTGKRRWNSSITAVSCLSGATREGQKTVQGGEMSQLAVKIVKVRQSSGTFSIILTVSQLSGASAFCWIELPPIICRFQWLAITMSLLCHHQRNEDRKKWPSRSHEAPGRRSDLGTHVADIAGRPQSS